MKTVPQYLELRLPVPDLDVDASVDPAEQTDHNVEFELPSANVGDEFIVS